MCICIYVKKWNEKAKKWKMKRKEKISTCVCAYYSPLLSIYIDIWGSFYRVWLLVRVCMWAFWDIFFFVFTLSYIFENKMSDIFLGALGHCPFHHYIHCWCDFIPCLIWVKHHFFFVYSLFCYHPRHWFWFILFTSPPCSFLTLTYFRFDISLASFLHISLSIWFASLSYYWYFIHIRHPQVHGSRALLYMLHFIHEGMSFLSLGIWA